MLQAVPKAIKNAFRGSFIKKICNYLHDCVREEVKSSTFRNLKTDKDNKWTFLKGDEIAFSRFDEPQLIDGKNHSVTEIMIQSDMNSKEKYLIYGYLFLVGKNTKTRKNNEFLTPILYAPAKLTRVGLNIELTILEENISLNTGALAQLIQKEDEAEVDAMLSGLLDVVPKLPLKEDDLEIFLTTLKSLIPEIDIDFNNQTDKETDYGLNELNEDLKNKNYNFNEIENIDENQEAETNDIAGEQSSRYKKVKLEKLRLEKTQALVLTTRPSVTAGVLHELTAIADKPTGTFRETVLNVINDEFLETTGQKELEQIENIEKNVFAITPLSLSDSQFDVIKKIETNDLLAVYGPPGTGKSQTIVNVAAHFIANGKTVLVASRMDKAVDVVAQRLNELNAPFLALRAGRANYQRQLNFKLQELLSNKVDLNSSYDNPTADTIDMKELLKEIKRLEARADEIIKLEEKYSEINEEYQLNKDAISKLCLISKEIRFDDLQKIKIIFSQIEEIEEKYKKGLFDKIKLSSKYSKLKKLINAKKIANIDVYKRLPYELNVLIEKAKLNKIEDNIMSLGNLHQILRKIKNLKHKQKKLAVDIIRNKRRTAIKNILSDPSKRRRLMIHAKSLVSRKTANQKNILEKEDFKPLLAAFPCWCATTYAISNSIPLKPAMFDVVIIDEASQCDIASCIPILYRASKAIIVGDDKQLTHLSFLEKSKEQSFLAQYSIGDRYQLTWRYRENSMFDLANYYSTTPVLLDEHFRSPAPIIEFSSKEFYGGKIKVMNPNINNSDIVELRIVKDARVDNDATRNVAECEEIIKTIQEIIINDERKAKEDTNHKPVSIGVISPFRAQVDLIKKAMLKVFDVETLAKHQLDAGTAHTYQGDERDIMLLSWTFAPNSHSQSLVFAQKPNLFNVAITRARKKLINFVSRPINELPTGLLRDYLEYIKKVSSTPFKNTFKNTFEKEVFDAVIEEFPTFKNKMYIGVEMGGVCADILIDRVVIEIDGIQDNPQERFSISPMKKQALIERAGYNVIRITKREWEISPQACLNRIREAICAASD